LSVNVMVDRMTVLPTSLIWKHDPHPIIWPTGEKQNHKRRNICHADETHSGLDELLDPQPVDDALVEEEHVELEQPDEGDVSGHADAEPLRPYDERLCGLRWSHGECLALSEREGMKVAIAADDVSRQGHGRVCELCGQGQHIVNV